MTRILALIKSWLIEFLTELKKLNITWISGGSLSIRTINNDNVIQMMYESGIGLFNLAIESGSNDTLKRVKKPRLRKRITPSSLSGNMVMRWLLVSLLSDFL